MFEYAVHTECLSCHFGELRAVDGLSLEVPKGIVFGFLGPNGSGKTTTIRLLLGLLEPTQGRADVMGFDVRENADQVRELAGALLEHTGLYERLNAVDNLEFYGRINRMPRLERQARIRELLVHFGLWERRDEQVGKWSRGMKQKLAVARALLHHPAILFLDEPTAGLDPLAAAALREDIAALVEDSGVTVFMNTHNLPEAEKLCTQVGVIRNGKLLAVGSPDQLRIGTNAAHLEISGSGFSQSILEKLRVHPVVESVIRRNSHLDITLSDTTGTSALITFLVNAGAQVVFAAALIPVNIFHGDGKFLIYSLQVVLSGWVLSFLLACLMSNIGVLVSLRAATVKQAQQTLALSVFIFAYAVPMAGIYGLGFLPEQIRDSIFQPILSGEIGVIVLMASALLVILNIVLFVITTARFQRNRLIFNQ